MKKLLFPIILAAVLTSVFTSCVKDETYVPPTVGDSDIVLNEIMAKDPVSDLDWIELYNMSDVEADISGYLLADAADPLGGFAIPAGTKIAAKGYYVVNEGGAGFTFGISSGGEDVSFGKPDGTLLDLVTVPPSQADGTTFSRLPDGGETWANGTEASKGAANIGDASTPSVSDVAYDVAPAAGETVEVIVTFATTETVSEVAVFYATGDTPAYDVNNKIVGSMGTGTATIIMTDLNIAAEKVSFFVAITLDDASVYYYDKDNKSTVFATLSADATLWDTYTPVAGGVAAPQLEVTFGTAPTVNDSIPVKLVFSTDIEITEARIYFASGNTPEYIKNNKVKGEDASSFTQTGVIINMAGIDVEDASGTIVGTTSDPDIKISFYVRIALTNGNEYYYGSNGVPILDTDDDGTDDGPSDDFKADPNLWDTYTPKNAVSVTKFDFPSSPTSTGDILVDIEFSSSETIEEARIYYAIGDSPVYIKDNKIKGEDDGSFTQTGVTINMKDVAVVDGDGSANGTCSDAGAKITFYLRIATATSEYYFAAGSLAAIDDSPNDSILDESDDFKADPTLWDVYNVQSK